MVARWAARLSALLVHGEALVVREVMPHLPSRCSLVVAPSMAGMPCHCLEGGSTYELLVL